MSCECEPSCACLGLSILDQRLLRLRKELAGELNLLWRVGTHTELKTLVREFRELHRLLLLSGSDAPLHALLLHDYNAAEQMLASGHSDHTQSENFDEDPSFPFSESQSWKEAVLRRVGKDGEQSSSLLAALSVGGSIPAKWPPTHTGSSAESQLSKP